MATAIISVQGNAEPTPSGAIAIRKIIAPMDPVLNIHPLNNMETAINAWQVAIKPTAKVMCRLNHP